MAELHKVEAHEDDAEAERGVGGVRWGLVGTIGYRVCMRSQAAQHLMIPTMASDRVQDSLWNKSSV